MNVAGGGGPGAAILAEMNATDAAKSLKYMFDSFTKTTPVEMLVAMAANKSGRVNIGKIFDSLPLNDVGVVLTDSVFVESLGDPIMVNVAGKLADILAEMDPANAAAILADSAFDAARTAILDVMKVDEAVKAIAIQAELDKL